MTEAIRSLLAFGLQGSLFALFALALAPALPRVLDLPRWMAPIAAAAGVAILGYIAFWLYFASPVVGRVFSWLALAGAVAAVPAWNRRRDWRDRLPCSEWLPPLALAATIGAGVVALTCLSGERPFSFLAANRYLTLPVDNQLPAMFADRLWNGQSPRHLFGNWLSSDRPPLQTGWLLLTRPVLEAAAFDPDTAASAGGVCFQLLWVPALWAFLRCLSARPIQAAAIIAALSFTGFFLVFTAFTWPKLGAASFTLAAFLLWWTDNAAPTDAHSRTRFLAGGVCAALGWLAHGGVAFSLLGLIPLAAASVVLRRRTAAAWGWAALGFAVLAIPWLAYQKGYEPPGDRLLKYHLAGVTAPDSRDFAHTLVESYRRIGWREALARRAFNMRLQGAGAWKPLATFHPRNFLVLSRSAQFAYTGYAFAWWLPGLIALPAIAWRQRVRSRGIMIGAAAWWISGWLAWLALMFDANQAIVHQGTLLTQLLGFALLAWSALSVHRVFFLVLAAAQAALFVEVWTPGMAAVAGPMDTCAAVVAVFSGIALLGAASAVMCERKCEGHLAKLRLFSKPARPLGRACLALGVLLGILGSFYRNRYEARALPVADIGQPPPGDRDFIPGGVYFTTNPRAIPPGIQTLGSWRGSDAFQGSYLTDWFQARPSFTLLVAGYPRLAPNLLEIEVRKKDGSLVSLPFAGENPHESWQPWAVHLASDAQVFRVRAIDASSRWRGWLGFSEPFARERVPRYYWPFLRTIASFLLGLGLLGSAARRLLRTEPQGA